MFWWKNVQTGVQILATEGQTDLNPRFRTIFASKTHKLKKKHPLHFGLIEEILCCSYKILPLQTQLTWENAKEGCKDKFIGPDGGRLFEPMTLAENKLVYDVAKAILNLQHLIRCSSHQIPNLQVFYTNFFSGLLEGATVVRSFQ